MRTTIDRAGRLVIPKALRDEVGLEPGEVEITRDGAGIRLEPVAGTGLVERRGRLVIPSAGASVDDDLVRELRDGDQR
jgi:AbrB family looped-hinge helix DNA binding protein